MALIHTAHRENIPSTPNSTTFQHPPNREYLSCVYTFLESPREGCSSCSSVTFTQLFPIPPELRIISYQHPPATPSAWWSSLLFFRGLSLKCYNHLACMYIFIFTLAQSEYVAYCLFIEAEDVLLSHSCQEGSVAESHVVFNMIRPERQKTTLFLFPGYSRFPENWEKLWEDEEGV